MPESLNDLLRVLIPLLLGGSGYAFWHWFFTRARVYADSRDERTIPIISETRRAEIEDLLREKGIPTAFCKVEWWNRGRRAAEDITIEVRVDGKILTWEISPSADSLAAPWSCQRDPRGSGSDPAVIRVHQEKLMPKARCSLVLGYDTASATCRSDVKAFSRTGQSRHRLVSAAFITFCRSGEGFFCSCSS